MNLFIILLYGFLANFLVRVTNLLFMKFSTKNLGEYFIFGAFGIVLIILLYNLFFSLYFTEGSKTISFGVLDTISVFLAIVISFTFQYFYLHQQITSGQYIGLILIFIGVLVMNFYK